MTQFTTHWEILPPGQKRLWPLDFLQNRLAPRPASDRHAGVANAA